MLDSSIKSQLEAALKNLREPICIVASLDETDASQAMRMFLTDVNDASEKITVKTDGGAQLKPSFTVAKKSEFAGSARVEFAGIPLGHEFTSFVLALLWCSGHPPKVEESLLGRIGAIDEKIDFKVFMSTECHNCPEVVQGLLLLAALNPNVKTTVLEGGTFPREVEKHNVLSIPKVFKGEDVLGSGRMTLEELLNKVAGPQETSKEVSLDSESTFDVLVLGGGPAGVAAAVYAARKGIRVGLIAERIGGQTNDTLKIENYPSVLETDGPTFAKDLERQAKASGVIPIVGKQVESVVSLERPPAGFEVGLKGGPSFMAKSLVVATGARWRTLGVPGESEYLNKGVAFCPHCDGLLFKGKRVAVVGGGNSGVEAAIDLAGLAAHVVLLEYGESLKADSVLIDRLKALKNVETVTSAKTERLIGDGNRLTQLSYKFRKTGVVKSIELDGVFVQIGLAPNTDFLHGLLETNQAAEIAVDAENKTSRAGIFAAGDCTDVPYKQIVVAAGEGAKAALSAFDYLVRLPTE